jgi:hypothetical protein
MVKARSIKQRKYNSTTKQKKRRAGRNKAARKYGRPGKDVNHKDGNPRNNKRSNLSLESPSKNRARKPKRLQAKKKPRKR